MISSRTSVSRETADSTALRPLDIPVIWPNFGTYGLFVCALSERIARHPQYSQRRALFRPLPPRMGDEQSEGGRGHPLHAARLPHRARADPGEAVL